MPELEKRLIIGGGLAGIAAAYWCRRQNPDYPVVLYEREEELLAWTKRFGPEEILLGCLADHEAADAGQFPGGGPHAAGIVEKWPGVATRDWLTSIGVNLRSGKGGQFRAADAANLRNVLAAALSAVGVERKTGFALETISRQPDGRFRIWSRDGMADEAGALLLATGGERNHGMALAREFGLEESPILPGFVRLKTASPKLGEQLGPLSRHIRLRCPRSGLKAEGFAEFSSRGLEGEALSRLSCQLCTDWKQRGYRLSLEIDWVPDLTAASMRGDLQSRILSGRRKPIGEEAVFGFTRRQWLAFLAISRIDPETPWMRLKSRKLQTLVQRLKAHQMAFTGMGLPSGERAWAGGIRSHEVEWSSGRATRLEGLYFAGEILDLLGMPAGPHVNLVWASGHLAGSAMALSTGADGD
jgi:predicted Rossmann fold flavoprotein